MSFSLNFCKLPPSTGYGKMCHNIRNELIDKNFTISETGSYEILIQSLDWIRHPKHQHHDYERSIVFTMGESSILPQSSVLKCNKAKFIIVPSEYNKTIFINNGITRPIGVVPLGVDTNIYKKTFRKKDDNCVFGFVGTFYKRKNIPFLIKSFKKAFTNEKCKLIIKTSANCYNQYGVDSNLQIQFITEDYSEKQMVNFYNSLDGFISCSHAEGFGLPQLESMACGVPVISPCFGGITEFFDSSVGYDVDYKIIESSDSHYKGEWCSAIEESLIDKMMCVYKDREKAKSLGEKALKRAKIFTWEKTAENLIKAIDKWRYSLLVGSI